MRQKIFSKTQTEKAFSERQESTSHFRSDKRQKIQRNKREFLFDPHYTLAWAAARIHDTEGRQTKIPEPEFVIFRGWSNKNPRARIRHFQAEGSNKNPRAEKISK